MQSFPPETALNQFSLFFPIVETSLLGDKARDHFLLRVTGADRLDFYFVILYWFFCLAKL
jgi:hypothetical protein